MYLIKYLFEEDIFDFTVHAKHPFEAIKIWQETVECLGKCEMLCLRKETYVTIF